MLQGSDLMEIVEAEDMKQPQLHLEDNNAYKGSISLITVFHRMKAET